MTFKEWVALEAEELEIGCGRYRDMRSAFRAGQEEFRRRVAAKYREIHRGPKTTDPRPLFDFAEMVDRMPLEGDDE